jgi:hypothetical protein
MLTSLQIQDFEASGRRAARAVNVGDDSLWCHEREWHNRRLALLSPADRREAKRAFDLEYLVTRERWIAPRCGYGER